MESYVENIACGFCMRENEGVRYLTIPSFDSSGKVRHLFTTRIGGVSKGPYESLNLSVTREASAQNKRENYGRVCAALGRAYDVLTLVNYAHGDGIYHAQPSDAGKGLARPSDLPDCDAMLVSGPGATAVTLHADCVPVFFLDNAKGVAGVSHAGWRGVLGGLPAKIVREMQAVYGSRPSDILVGIGPHIMACCFEVQQDVWSLFEQAGYADAVRRRDGKTYVDMQHGILMQMKEAGVPAQNVTAANLCTYCNEELFYSHRRDKGNTGAMGSFITLEG